MLKIRLVGAVALVDLDGRVLLTKRPKGKHLEGLWEFPGGKIEKSEVPEEAVIRELKEELDISIEESCLAPVSFASHQYQDFHLVLLLYVCRVWSGIPRSVEGQQLKWVSRLKLKDVAMPPADVPLVAAIRDLL